MKYFSSAWRLLCVLAFWLPLTAQAADASDYDAVIQQILTESDKLVADYQPAQGIQSADAFTRLYFDVFESSGLEFQVGHYDAELLLDIEMAFGQLSQACLKGQSAGEVAGYWHDLRHRLRQIDTSDMNTSGWMGSFTQALLILLREGFEAILLISVLLVSLSRAGKADQIPLMYAGIGTALVASLATAWAFHQWLANNMATLELIEGAVLLIAALVLTYISLWMISQQESRHWQQQLQQRLDHHASQANKLAIFLIAFVAVYREGAETILFVQAAMLDADGQYDALWAGMGVAAVILAIVFLFLNRVVRIINMKYFFRVTSLLFLIMGVSFVGKGVLELQVSGLLPLDRLEGVPQIPLLGIFANLQSLMAQGGVVVIYLALYWWYKPAAKGSKLETAVSE